MKKIIAYICILISLVLALSSCGSPKTVMTVGGYELTEDVDALFNGDAEKRNMFLAPYALAEGLGIDIESDDFRDAVSTELQRLFVADYKGSDDLLDAELEAEGISKEVYEKLVEQSVLTDKVYLELTKNGTIETNEAVLCEEFLSGEAVRVKRIMVLNSNHGEAEAKERVTEAKERLSVGTPFEDVMKEYAEYDISKGDLGNLGDSYVIVRGNVEAGYEELCFSLAEGEISEPFETSAGMCIVKRYPLTEEDLDTILDDLVTSYCEGQYNMILEKASKNIGK